MRHYLLASLTVVLLVSGCDGGSTGRRPAATDEPVVPLTDTPVDKAATRNPTPTLEPTIGVVPADAEDVVALAREDLAERLDTEPGAIGLVSVEAVEWPDTSLGCPEPGERYGETVDSGFRIVLRAGGERYLYHTLRQATVILCEEERINGTPTAPSPVESGLDGVVESAKEDLAERLSISADEIEVVEARSVVWPDASLGCPQPGMAYAQVATPGFLVLLETGDETHAYHADARGSMVLCEAEGVRSLPPIPVTPGEIMDGEPWMPAD